GVVALGIFVVLLLAAFSSPAPSFQDSVPKGSKPIVATEGPNKNLNIYLPVPLTAVTALGYHGTDGNSLPLEPVGRQANDGVVNDLSGVEKQTLASVTHDAGNHVTIEVDPAPILPVS